MEASGDETSWMGVAGLFHGTTCDATGMFSLTMVRPRETAPGLAQTYTSGQLPRCQPSGMVRAGTTG